MNNQHIKILGIVFLFIAGCSINVHDHDRADNGDSGKDKDVTIKSPLGGMHVRTENVDPKQIGLSIYPGARLKEKDGNNDSKADVNIDTPWFGLKVVALKYVSDDPQDKIWDYYKKELSKYGKVLECRPGSPDMNMTAKEKNQLTCDDKDKKNGKVNFDTNEINLRVGTEDRQRVVGIKRVGNTTEFELVYVETHGEDKDAA